MQTAMGDPIVGRVLEGRYRVVERLARGGMSTVYTAVDERLDREVAVKVMSSALSTDPAFADRFTREARVAARLAHLNAVAVYDQGTDAGHVFLVMELVRGRTLRDLLRERGALSPALAVSIMEPVLGALAAAHRAGLVHRDVKPENILLADDGAVKVADFGLARAVEADASSTRTGLMMGTVAYCPPEQIARGSADARSDVYSAGVVLFELLTGSAPYSGDSAMAVAYQHVNSDVPPPSGRRPGIPPALDEVVLRATSREPSGRPLDAGALLAELHDVRLDLGLPVVAVPPRPRPGGDPDATQVIPIPRPAAGGSSGQPAGRHSVETSTAPTFAAAPAAEVLNTTVSQRPGGPPDSRGPQPPERSAAWQRRRRARRRTAIVVAIILLLGLLTGYGAWWLTVGRYRQVPDVSGMSQSVATRQLVADGFSVNPVTPREYSESMPSGSIIRTDPAADKHLIKGKMVSLIVSRGQERFTVPDVAGRPYATAQQSFKPLPVQLVPSDASDATGKIAAGNVIRTNPPAGQKVKRGQLVTVFVSTGPPVIGVPDVRDRSKPDATKILTDAGFTLDYAEDYSDTVAEGRVIRQSPDAGATAVKFSTITLTVSKGRAMVTIPDISQGDDPAEAKSALEKLGLVVSIQKKRKSIFDFSGYVVDSVEPGPGTSVRRGSTVVLRLK